MGRRIFFGIMILAIFGIAASKYFFKPSVTKIEEPEKILTTQTTGLTKIIDDSLATSSGTYGIVVKNLKTGETFVHNAQRVFESASIYKLWVMGAAYKYFLPEQLKEYREYIFQMITISDNDAAILLTDKIGIAAISQFLEENGLLQSKVGIGQQNPRTTPADMAIFLKRLYYGKLANEQYTNEMIDFLKWQKLNDGLPKYLPEKIVVAHKTGELDINTHDAGIVYTDFGDYIIVIFSESDSRDQTKEQIATISEAVYQYFSTGGE